MRLPAWPGSEEALEITGPDGGEKRCDARHWAGWIGGDAGSGRGAGSGRRGVDGGRRGDDVGDGDAKRRAAGKKGEKGGFIEYNRQESDSAGAPISIHPG